MFLNSILRHKKSIAASSLVFSSMLLTACNGFVTPLPLGSEYQGKTMMVSGLPAPGFFTGTAVQWNEDYAVTARHLIFMNNVSYRCSDKCDMMFVKRKAKGPVPNWRTAVPGETLVTSGYNSLLMPVYGKGKAANNRLTIRGKGYPDPLPVTEAASAMGMSGGPIYGESDKAVVGIVSGMAYGHTPPTTTDPLNSANFKRYTYYVPYEKIQAEWELFNNSKGHQEVTKEKKEIIKPPAGINTYKPGERVPRQSNK